MSAWTVGQKELVEFFEQLAACPREGAGAWLFEHGSQTLGLLFFENSRVCWSAVPGRGRRLVELIATYAEVEQTKVEEIIRDCVKSRQPFVDALISGEVASRERILMALRRDTTESLLQIAATPERRGIWRPHRGSGYAAPAQFSLTELLVEAGAEAVSAPRDALVAAGSDIFGVNARFVYLTQQGLPVAASSVVGADRLDACMTLANRAGVLASSSSAFMVTPGEAGITHLVWRDGPYLASAETDGPPHGVLQRLLARAQPATRE